MWAQRATAQSHMGAGQRGILPIMITRNPRWRIKKHRKNLNCLLHVGLSMIMLATIR